MSTDLENQELTQNLLVQNESEVSAQDKQQQERKGKTSLVVSIFTLIFCIPALIGSCCWPVVIAGIFSLTASAASKQFAHALTLVINLVILTNLIQYVAWTCASRKGSHWVRYGPTYLVSLSLPLICADSTRHVLVDNGYFQEALGEYRAGCHYEYVRCLSAIGWLFTIFFTYAGFACLLIGILWAANMHKKMAAGWRTIRRGEDVKTLNTCETCNSGSCAWEPQNGGEAK
eukprot:TRINITY_DN8358_c1_g1_i1.p2 TRINITY_DN8358_c1_g1~~TRINITY_DN8358_c1_g1_i1.p2  ORF type:complete len:260 (-),score=6.55 TRINITY_DN8358_c1_g1_i1:371-1063(-)